MSVLQVLHTFIFITHKPIHTQQTQCYEMEFNICSAAHAAHDRKACKHSARPHICIQSLNQSISCRFLKSPFLAEITLTLMRKEVLNGSESRSPMGHKPCDFLSSRNQCCLFLRRPPRARWVTWICPASPKRRWTLRKRRRMKISSAPRRLFWAEIWCESV